VKRVRLYYTPGGPQGWTEKKWLEVSPYKQDNIYYFGLPAARLKPDVQYFASVIDNQDGSASTLVRALLKVKLTDGQKTFASSSPVKLTYRNEPPFTLLGGAADSSLHFQLVRAEQIYRVRNL
jgi:hypothetical protein